MALRTRESRKIEDAIVAFLRRDGVHVEDDEGTDLFFEDRSGMQISVRDLALHLAPIMQTQTGPL